MSYNVIVNNISLPYKVPAEEAVQCAVKLMKPYRMTGAVVRRKSVDARKREHICFVYSVKGVVEAEIPESELKKRGASIVEESDEISCERGTEKCGRPAVVGFGPCGMFCALLLAEYGYRPVVLERGGNVAERRAAVERFFAGGALDVDSNVQFGAGGAGTFSDGKLTTRIGDPRCDYILRRFYEFGAPEEILTEGKPHIGTDRLVGIVEKLAERITALGGEIRYNTRVTGLKMNGGRLTGLETNRGSIECGYAAFAVGHSARDVYDMFAGNGLILTPKPFSVGVRIEHMKEDIDRALYGAAAGDPLLGPASYNFSLRENGGADCAYTFCMCPGGRVIAASSEENGVVVNGMSDFARASRNSNCAVCVNISPDDPVGFQRALERRAFELGGNNYRAPTQTAGGFFDGRTDRRFGRVKPDYTGVGTQMSDLNSLFDARISSMLKRGISCFGRRLEGFDSRDAVLTGVESRTSAPYRIERSEAMTAVGCDNLYPCGEGAGYAGGIMSAAADGLRCAEKLISRFAPDGD